jgi:hypothetical protein
VYQDVHLRKATHRYQRCCSWWYEIGGQSTEIAQDLRGSKAREFRILGAGGAGSAPAPCGFGARCPSFSYVQGRTRAALKWPILMAQSGRTFTRVHRRWGQNWGQPVATEHSTAWCITSSAWVRSIHSHKGVCACPTYRPVGYGILTIGAQLYHTTPSRLALCAFWATW